MIQVREYALLTSNNDQQTSMDLGVVSQPTFDWLLDLQARWRGDLPLLRLQNRHVIKLESYVGFLQSPNGQMIEVLPKTQTLQPTESESHKARKLLRDMLITTLKLKPREADSANLQRLNTPLHEWIISEFLNELTKLVRRGLRFDYHPLEEESRFLRGQLNQTMQSRQTPDRATMFHIRHDVFTANRCENRLLKTALNYTLRLTGDANNRRLANELSHQLVDLEPYDHPTVEVPRWQAGKLMQPYQQVKPWCELILEKLNPNFQKGLHKGIALMFPMEILFEKYVAHWLDRSLSRETTLKLQARSFHLLGHQPVRSDIEEAWFRLEPDMVLKTLANQSVLDTKWKLLDSHLSTSGHKYGLKQSDLYQLFAYGQKYMNGKGSMMLIYPYHKKFTEPLPVFRFDENLYLWVVPFDMEAKRLIPGNWSNAFPGFRDITELAS
jgi:5-methylcytosine-specific restriction enzyme subunit McrC